MKKLLLSLSIVGVLCLTGSIAYAARLSVDTFLPPAQAESDAQESALKKVENADAVKKTNDGIDGKATIGAASAQDAINTFVDEGMPGCVQITFPSGMGFVSTGLSTYQFMKNSTATVIAQRNAYVKAYTDAKKSLAQTLYGLSSKGKTELLEQMETNTSSEKDLVNTSSSLSQNTEEMVKGMLRGYVVYSVQDNQDKEKGYGNVSVTIVTTPKTMGNFKRPDLNSISTSSIREGIAHVFVELQNGLVPPVGGKTVAVPQTGEIAFIAFGSAVVHQNQNPALQQKLFINATKIAQMRARNALVGILQGDDIESISRESEETSEMSKQFEEIIKDDPINEKDEKSFNELENQMESFKNTSTFSEAVSSLRSGIVPPGVTVRTFPNSDRTMITGFAVYLPSTTAQAHQAAKNMQTSSPMTPYSDSSVQDTTKKYDVKSGNAPTQGPSGRVTNDSDL